MVKAIVMEIITRQLRAGQPLEFLYSFDFDGREREKSTWEGSTVEIEVGRQRFEDEYRKDSVEVMVSECKNGVDSSSILCCSCKKWIHK